jgi:WS/DGAT/MGAT family acyltransferase
VRRSALPAPGDERELGILVSRLHSNQLDFQRPLWEMHLIEGLKGGRFAVYVKTHHALVDGYSGVRMLMRSMSRDPDERDTPFFFLREPEQRPPRDEGEEPATVSMLLKAVREQYGATRDVSRALMKVAKAARANDRHLLSPFQAPKSILNRRIGRNRRLATQQFPIDRMKEIAKRRGGTLNDISVAMCAASIRRLLLELDALPDKPLVAMLPVNIRPKNDPGGGNAVGAILATLATDIEDPVERFDTIVESTSRAKEQLEGMSHNAIIQYSSMLMSPILMSQIPGAAGRMRPGFNIVISNVPGPDRPLYFRGWRMEATYPISIPFNGYGLNITLQSYMGTLNFGFIGDRDGLPHMQRLAVYSADALEELDVAIKAAR